MVGNNLFTWFGSPTAKRLVLGPRNSLTSSNCAMLVSCEGRPIRATRGQNEPDVAKMHHASICGRNGLACSSRRRALGPKHSTVRRGPSPRTM